MRVGLATFFRHRTKNLMFACLSGSAPVVEPDLTQCSRREKSAYVDDAFSRKLSPSRSRLEFSG